MIGLVTRWIVRTALLLLVASTLAFLLVAFVLNTESGTRWVIARADHALPGTLTINQFEGTIWRGLQIEKLTYSDASQQIEIDEVAFDLFWPAILAGRLSVDDLQAQSVRRENLLPRPDEAQALQIEMQPLPLPIGVRNASITSVDISDGEESQQLRNIVIKKLRIDGRRFTAESVRLRRDTVRATVNELSIRLAGQVATTGVVSWELADRDFSGQGTVSGSLTELEFQQQVSGPYPATVAGTLFLLGRVQAAFDANVRWESWDIEGRTIENGDVDVRGWLDEANVDYRTTIIDRGTRYDIAGTATGNLDALSSFSANVSNKQINVELVGKLTRTPEFSATATAAASFIDAQLISSNLQGKLGASADLSLDAIGTLSIRKLLATGTVNDFAVHGRGDAVLTAGRWQCASCVLNVGENRITLAGDQLEVDWYQQGIDLSARAEVRFGEQDVSGTVRAARINQIDAGDWELQHPFAFRIAEQQVDLDSSEWLGRLGTAQILQLQFGNDGLQVNANVRDVPLQLANQTLPPNYRLSGFGNASIDVRQQAGRWNGFLKWSQTDTVLHVTEANGDITALYVQRATANVELVDNKILAEGDLSIDPGILASATVTLDGLAPDAMMNGNLKLTGEDWSWIAAFVPQIDAFAGVISADITALGPLDGPTFTGTAKWLDGSVVIPAYNVRLTEVGVTVTGASNGDATVEGSAQSGAGNLQIAGRLEDLMLPGRRAQFTITGQGAELANWPEYHIWGSPDIKLAGTIGAWDISGKLEVPRAIIEPRAIPENAVTESPDVEVLGEEGTVSRQTRVTGETRLVLGDRVNFSALGLETRLRGNILFKQLEGRPISAEGRLSLVEGTYATQGQNLKIEQGELIFTGPLDDPLVDVRAVRIIEDFDGTVKAGIHLRGRAQNLTTTVFSEPAMADANALSYLILGRPLSQASDTDGGELSGAAVALGLRQMTRFTDQIGQSIGVDELSLAGDGGETTALVAGKQVNSRLYARYAYGVFSQLGTLLLRYRLNSNLTLEAGTGENQSLDILYTIEK